MVFSHDDLSEEFMMKSFFVSLLISFSVFAECEIAPLQDLMIAQYKTILPVKNAKGEIGTARAKNFVVSDYLMKVKNENFLIANFELDIKWLTGKLQSVKTLAVGTVDPETCTIEIESSVAER